MSTQRLATAIAGVADQRAGRAHERARNDFGTVLETGPLRVELHGAKLTLDEDALLFMGVDPRGLRRGDPLYVTAVDGEYVVGGAIEARPARGSIAPGDFVPGDVVRDHLPERIQQSLWEPGDIKQTVCGVVPPGWLACEGQEVGRLAYPDLFEAIGTYYGAGDGLNTFLIPDGRGRTLTGRGGPPSVAAPGLTEGQTDPALRRPKHTHLMPGHTHSQGGSHSHTVPAHYHYTYSRSVWSYDNSDTVSPYGTKSVGEFNTNQTVPPPTNIGGAIPTTEVETGYLVVAFMVKV